MVVAGLVTSVDTAGARARSAAVLRCNGSAALCDRPLNQVAFAGAHNAMSAATSPGWLFAENDFGITAQLQYGVRALLLKSHYGIPTGINLAGSELVVTDTATEIKANRDAEIAELSPQAVARAQQLEALAPGDSNAHDVYLCHVYCALGATKMTDALSDVRRFIDRNPDEVVILFIGDYVTPADTAKQFEAAGLINRIWTYDTTAPPPTLRQMIDAHRNLLVLSEHFGGTPAWYTKGYGIFQDTPFTFAVASRLQLRRQPRADRRPAVPDQPLDHQQAAAVARGRRRRSTPTAPSWRRSSSVNGSGAASRPSSASTSTTKAT